MWVLFPFSPPYTCILEIIGTMQNLFAYYIKKIFMELTHTRLGVFGFCGGFLIKKSFVEDHSMNTPNKFSSNWPSDPEIKIEM